MDHGSGSTIQLSLRQVDEISTLLPKHETWLSTPELQRLQSLQTNHRRAQFLAGHWLARHSAALWLGGHWADYQLSSPDDMAPTWLSGPAAVDWRRIYVSLTHSGNWVACALALRPIGVDVECSQQPRDFGALGRWIFSGTELEAFLQLAPEVQRRRFYMQWVLKEAWIKQSGTAQVKRVMQAVQFASGAGASPALVAQSDEITLALYPARSANTHLVDQLLSTMQWSDWACMLPR
jgi:4'-phosphopantetheinyl transferase